MNAGFEASYYQRREERERELAANAADPGIARIHLDMAASYADLVSECEKPSLKMVGRG